MSTTSTTYVRTVLETSNSITIGTAEPSPVASLPYYRRCRPPVIRITDPVCGKVIHPNELSQVRDGTTFYFCSAHCRRKFMPAAILERKYRLTWNTGGSTAHRHER